MAAPSHRRRHHRVPLISIEMVSKTYGDDPLDFKNLVLRNIYLQIHEGEFVTVFGPSGSGKSTLLNLIAGLERPTGGRIMVRRRDLSKYDSDELASLHRRKMGFVFQSINLIKSLNVWENVALPQTASNVGYAERKRKALRLLRLLHLDQYANRHPNELSGGEQQRVAIARALINEPYFLLVDEPTGNLDSKSAEEVMNVLKDIHDNAKHTIILVTHNPDQVKFATRIIYLEDGQIVIEENRPARDQLAPTEPIADTPPPSDETLAEATGSPVEAPPVESDVVHYKPLIDTEQTKGQRAKAKKAVATAPKSASRYVAATMAPDTPPDGPPKGGRPSSAATAPKQAASPPTALPPSPDRAATPPTDYVNDDVVKTVVLNGETRS